ncbi:unnamed protein product [Didymodactylos carnosus]|uniref:Uncharacterized protein n=1 Tax=Didymodactylos carnosus TaxID=1234261 RepID=A0A814B0H4_9BILA|nr:unnamed protein product [Didymodactylos carnosus]CAF0921354.1 unnamed protein product [Didymodactylos carnosus]CAF3671647.1 unnamed protein product [Didymodactylos carnosus]CAF3700630.1 unnamed protein product [Didymodactylos carnosus]
MSKSSTIDEIKVVVIGDGYTGKTTLCVVYKDGQYPQDPYVPTIFENYAATVTLFNKKWILNLFDSAGQEEYDQLRIMAYPNTDVFILCFSVVDPDSYANILSKWIPELNRYSSKVPVILVGTKIDLRSDLTTLEQLTKKQQKPITQNQGEYLARLCSAKRYIECSSMLNFNVRDVFDQAVHAHMMHLRRTQLNCSWINSLICCGSRRLNNKKHKIPNIHD